MFKDRGADYMKKKGFTLIELLAVIVILAIIMLVAGSNVFGILGDAEKNSFRTEFLSLLENAQTKASLDLMNGTISGSHRTVCYEDNDLDNYFDQKGKDYTYSVLVTYNNGRLDISGWMSSDKYKIENKDNTVASGDVLDNNGTPVTTTCGK